MGFGQMGHLVKLNIRNFDIISQNEQCSLVEWDILCLLHTYLLPSTCNFITYLPLCKSSTPTNPPTYLNVTHVPTYPPTYDQSTSPMFVNKNN